MSDEDGLTFTLVISNPLSKYFMGPVPADTTALLLMVES